uniref:DNA_MISMATCH_REPAIR_2 domain-containing protein n=1 Tax=Strongyloides papillosus TaxID=174720 RepID=A0A0N5BS41_STREA
MSFVGLSLSYSNGKLGAALYDKNDCTLSILEDISEDSEFRLLNSLINQTNPTHVTVNASQSEDFIKFVTDKSNEQRRDFLEGELDDDIVPETQFDEEDKEQSSNKSLADPNIVPESPLADINENVGEQENVVTKGFELTEYPSHTYATKTALDLIEKMYRTGQYQKAMVEYNNKAYKIDVTCINMVQSIGALLKTLDHLRVGVEFEVYSIKTPIKCIKLLTVDKLLEIDRSSLHALNILDNEYSPSITKIVGRKWGNRPKRGISILKICGQCSSSIGKALLKSWFERPSADIETIVNRHDAVDYFMSEQRFESVKIIKSLLSKVNPLEPIFRRLQEGSVKPNDWKALYKTITSAYNIGQILFECDCNLKLIPDYRDCCSKDMFNIVSLLAEIVDFDAIEEEGRFCVKPGIDERLDELKDIFENITVYLNEIAKEEFGRYNFLSRCRIGYIPLLGYLLAVPANDVIPPMDGVQFIFQKNDESHYKTPKMKELDHRLGDIKFAIKDLEMDIMLKLQKLIIDNIGKIRIMLKTIAVIDCVISFAFVSKELKWCRPTMVNQSVLEIHEARHPISEFLAVNPYIPNPILSGGSHTKIKLITGPNASGKSVYLKMTAICCYMAQIGCFVPATSATMGVLDKIIVRMYTLDNVLDGLSTFAKDLKQMGTALNRGTGRSLIIIDEFGIGTLKETGLSLFASCLNYWIDKGKENCPHIFASSHFHSLPNYLRNDPSILSYHTMEIHHQESTLLMFLYKLTTGQVERSFANHIALKTGLPRLLFERSEYVYEEIKKGVDVCDIQKLNYDDDEINGHILRIIEEHILEFEQCQYNGDYLQFLEIIKNEFLDLFSGEKKSGEDTTDTCLIEGSKLFM